MPRKPKPEAPAEKTPLPTNARARMSKLPQVRVVAFQRCGIGCRTMESPPAHEENCPRHQSFVMDALRKLEREWPHSTNSKSVLFAALSAECDPKMVAVKDEVVGWVITPAPQRIVYAYINFPMRQRGIMTAALLQLGFDVFKPIAVDLWSRAASRIVERGTWRLYPTVLG